LYDLLAKLNKALAIVVLSRGYVIPEMPSTIKKVVVGILESNIPHIRHFITSPLMLIATIRANPKVTFSLSLDVPTVALHYAIYLFA
jgi:hypothetical protein